MSNGWGPVEKDRSNGEQSQVDGKPLSIRSVAFSKGLGAHAASDVRYNLGGACSTFTASIGIDDEAAPNGSVAFQVYGDGTKIFDSGVLTGRDAAKNISVDVTNKTELRLVVTDGGNGVANDHADWANARVTCGALYVSDMTSVLESNGWGPVEKDKSNGEQAAGDGRTLSIRGATFPKGLGVHANSTVRYALSGQCTNFSAMVGTDDEVGSKGSVVFKVVADGGTLYDSGLTTGTMTAKSVSVDVTGRSQLDLIVADGGDGVANDHADWGNARLTCGSVVRSTSPTNNAPAVSAGGNQTTMFPMNAVLAGTVTDDGLPSNNVTIVWSQVSGPGTTNFSSNTTLGTSVSFSTPGTYVLRLTATDGALTAYSELTENVVAVTNSTIPAGAVEINPGDDAAAAVNSHGTGTTFFFHNGIHRMQSIQVKDGDTFVGDTGAVLSGARLLTSFGRQGSYYVVSGQTQHGDSVPGSTNCLASSPRCSYPEDLFFDNVPLAHVSQLSNVGPGKWFFDYSAQKIYFADDPTGHTVETSVTPFAFYGQADNVTIQNLTIEKYATPAQNGAILCAVIQNRAPQGHNWVVKDNTIRLNHGAAVFASDRMQILRNKIYKNGQMGLLGDGDSVLVQDNEISYNNYAGYEPGWEAGGTKFVGTTNIVLRGNYSHDNLGTGLWLDYNNSSFLIENNHTKNNMLYGIQQEIGQGGIIRNNVVENEGSNPTAPSTAMWYSGGINVSASSGVEVYGNTVTNCINGIGAIQADRGAAFYVKNLNVHDNTIVQNGGTASGIVKMGSTDDSIFNSWNNHFQHNTYTLSGNANFEWMNSGRSKSEWVGYGNDTTGVWK
jgi:hypothetical protein